MTLRSLVWLLRRDVFSQKTRLALLILCIGLSSFLFGLTASAVAYIHGELRPQLRALFPESRVVLRPARADVLFLRIEAPRIREETLEQVRQLEGVESVWPQLSASFPVSAILDRPNLDIWFETDVILFGVDEELVAEGLGANQRFLPRESTGDPLPVVVSEYFLDAYNLGFAETAGLPRLSRHAVVGMEFDLILGESTLGLGEARARPRTVRSRIVGLTSNPMLIGAIIPREELAEFNREYAPPNARTGFAALHVDMESPEDLERIEEFARANRLGAQAQRDVLEGYLRIVTGVEWGLVGAFLVVAMLASVGLLTTTATVIRERRPAWGLHRATGLPGFWVLLLGAGHALAAAIPSALIAGGALYGTSRLLDMFLGETIAEVSFIPGNPLVPTWEVFAATGAFALVFALVPALLFSFPIATGKVQKLLGERSL